MQLFVYVEETKEVVAIKVRKTDTIAKVETVICNEIGKPEPLRLTFNGNLLKNGSKLKDYGIVAESELVVETTPKFFVQVPDHGVLEYDLEPLYFVSELERKIAKETGIDMKKHQLTYGGKSLRKGHSLSRYNIESGSLIQLEEREEVPPGNPIKVTVRPLEGDSFTLDVFENDFVLSVKEKYGKKSNIKVDEMRFIYAGKQLEDEERLSYYNIIDGTVIHMVMRLRGC